MLVCHFESKLQASVRIDFHMNNRNQRTARVLAPQNVLTIGGYESNCKTGKKSTKNGSSVHKEGLGFCRANSPACR
jgi:hypothetical protein